MGMEETDYKKLVVDLILAIIPSSMFIYWLWYPSEEWSSAEATEAAITAITSAETSASAVVTIPASLARSSPFATSFSVTW